MRLTATVSIAYVSQDADSCQARKDWYEREYPANFDDQVYVDRVRYVQSIPYTYLQCQNQELPDGVRQKCQVSLSRTFRTYQYSSRFRRCRAYCRYRSSACSMTHRTAVMMILRAEYAMRGVTCLFHINECHTTRDCHEIVAPLYLAFHSLGYHFLLQCP